MRFLLSILLFLAGIALIFWASKPLWGEIAVFRSERSGVLQTLSELRNLQDARDNLLTAYNSLSKPDLEKLDQILPGGSDTGGLLVSLEKMTQDRGVRLRKAEFKTDDSTSAKVIQAQSSIFNTVDLSLSVSATYESFKSFLNALEKNSRIIDVTNISFSVGQTNLYEFILQADSYFAKTAPKVSNLRDIANIKIDTSFFGDPRFLELESVPALSPEDIRKGRVNPFVPI